MQSTRQRVGRLSLAPVFGACNVRSVLSTSRAGTGRVAAGTFVEPVSSPIVGARARQAGPPVRETSPSQGGTQSIRRAPLPLARLSSVSAAATPFLAAWGG